MSESWSDEERRQVHRGIERFIRTIEEDMGLELRPWQRKVAAQVAVRQDVGMQYAWGPCRHCDGNDDHCAHCQGYGTTLQQVVDTPPL